MTTNQLIEEALSLPVEERLRVADSLLQSLNTPVPAIDAKWAEETRNRQQELREGSVTPIAGEEVFAEVRRRLAR